MFTLTLWAYISARLYTIKARGGLNGVSQPVGSTKCEIFKDLNTSMLKTGGPKHW
jgi:hypothetical protein